MKLDFFSPSFIEKNNFFELKSQVKVTFSWILSVIVVKATILQLCMSRGGTKGCFISIWLTTARRSVFEACETCQLTA